MLIFHYSVCSYSTCSDTHLDKYTNWGIMTVQWVWRTHTGLSKSYAIQLPKWQKCVQIAGKINKYASVDPNKSIKIWSPTRMYNYWNCIQWEYYPYIYSNIGPTILKSIFLIDLLDHIELRFSSYSDFCTTSCFNL